MQLELEEHFIREQRDMLRDTIFLEDFCLCVLIRNSENQIFFHLVPELTLI